MKERPILMSTPMVIATLEDRKGQTRRIASLPIMSKSDGAKKRVFLKEDLDLVNTLLKEKQRDPMRIPSCPYGRIGDRLWIKEAWTGTWHPTRQSETHILLHYRADGGERFVNAPEDYVLPKAAAKVGNWVTPLFMSRWASRITLEIMDVRVERLQDISEEDCIAEGIEPVAQLGIIRTCGWKDYSGKTVGFLSPRESYKSLWESINGAGSWNLNPLVWCLSFRKI
jgi:hypothetical protein